MNLISNYKKAKYELDNFKEQLHIISKYEKQAKKFKKYLCQTILVYQNLISKVENDLKNIDGIEHKLYYEIAVNGTSTSKAIEKVAFEENKDVSTIWKNYYPNVKKQIKELQTITKKENSISTIKGDD